MKGRYLPEMKKEIVENGIHNYTPAEQYVPIENPLVAKHIDWFMGLKLGFMIHWAPGCQLGTYESWPLCDGDGNWSQSDVDWTDIPTFKEQYWNANRTFNPVKFRPDRIVNLISDCGFKYLLFTTKHHDGFCMFDTETTDYKITDPSCPFHTSPYADVTRSFYDECRKRGLAISVYFSKPDWHSDYYWHRAFGEAPDRNVNYSIEEHPELWEKYVEYTHKQIEELGTKYGKIDCLWLDGGWVNPENRDQDIHLEEIVEKLRSTTQPHLIVCDRTIGGKYENIVTPEKTVPAEPLFIPWETCATVGDKFSFHYTDHFKSGRELVHLLLDVVSKGGNLALNLALQPDGKLPGLGVASLKDFGRWLQMHGEGIYETVMANPYAEGKIKYTKKGSTQYAFYLYENIPRLPQRLVLTSHTPIKKVRLMRTNQEIPFVQEGYSVILNTKVVNRSTAIYADCFIMNS